MTVIDLNSKARAGPDAMPGRVLTRTEEIVRHETAAERLEGQAEHHRWEAARLISEELKAGKSQRKLAAEIGKDHKHVGYMKRVWSEWGLKSPGERPPFNEAYNSPEVRGTNKRVHNKEPQFGTIEEMADVFLANPEQAQMVQSAIKKAMERARDKVRDRLSGDSQHRRNKKVYDKEQSSKLLSEALKAVRKFVEIYKPENRESGENMADAFESAANMIRQRIAGMEE